MIRSRVLPEDKYAVGFFEIFQRNAAFADADAFVQGRAARLVAHVRTVRQIVRPELADKKLIEKGRLVARPTARVKGGCVRRRQGVQFAGHHRKSFVPFDRLIMSAAGALDHRMDQAALQFQPVIRLLL